MKNLFPEKLWVMWWILAAISFFAWAFTDDVLYCIEFCSFLTIANVWQASNHI